MLMTKKDRKIANQKAMISNRDRLIGDMEELVIFFKIDIKVKQ